MVAEDEISLFLKSSIPTVWALELLLLLKRIAPAGRRLDELVGELRSSTTAISEALKRLHGAGLVIEETDIYSYRAASPMLDQLVTETEKLYATKPLWVMKTIATANTETLQIFANSFKLKE